MERRIFAERPRRVALFVTCMVDMMYPNVGMSTVELLEGQGIEVIFPEEQTCCGQPAFNAGFRDEARVLAERFIDIFEPLVRSGRVDAIVAPSGSCTTMVSHFYAVLFEDPMLAALRERARFLSTVTFELTEFLVDALGVTDVGAHFNGRLTYHACCHLLREIHVNEQPHALIAGIHDADVVELTGAEDCCGFGGLFSIKNGPISTAMGERKVENIAASRADVVTLCDVSCMTHINGLLTRTGRDCRAVHIAEVLNNQLQADGDASSSGERPSASAPTEQPDMPRRWQDPRAQE
jgi:L-lactate dehydrogenase complex protein LldE